MKFKVGDRVTISFLRVLERGWFYWMAKNTDEAKKRTRHKGKIIQVLEGSQYLVIHEADLDHHMIIYTEDDLEIDKQWYRDQKIKLLSRKKVSRKLMVENSTSCKSLVSLLITSKLIHLVQKSSSSSSSSSTSTHSHDPAVDLNK